MPLVSVVMPSFEHERYIAEAMASVLDQSFDDLELIVVDDASTDRSPEIIRELAGRDSRVRPLLHRENQGIGRVFNNGIAQAKGKYLAILASDDLWLPGKLAKQVEVLEQDDRLVVWCEGLIIGSEGESKGRLAVAHHIHRQRKIKKSGDILAEILMGGLVLFAGLIAKTDSIRELGFDEQFKYMNDIKLSIELARRYDYHYIPEVLVKYRMHSANVTKVADVDGWARDAKLLEEYYEREFSDQFSTRSPQALFMHCTRAWVEQMLVGR